MHLTIRLLGTEVLHISTNEAVEGELPPPSPGDSTSYPLGFTAHMDRPHEFDTPDRDL